MKVVLRRDYLSNQVGHVKGHRENDRLIRLIPLDPSNAGMARGLS